MAGTSSTVPKRQLGIALRKLREEKEIERDVPAGLLACSDSKIGRIETGDVSVRQAELRELLTLYGVTGQERADLEQLAAQARTRRKRTSYGTAIPDWFRKYVNLEEAAVEIRSYDNELIRGLFQTEDYARAVIEANPLHRPADVDRLVAARMARQERILGDDPMKLWAVLSEAALLQQVGGPEVMRRQLARVRELADRPNITIQVTRLQDGAHAAAGFPFSLLKLPNMEGLDIVFLEDLTSARYVDNNYPQEQERYAIVWNHLTRSALPPDESAALLDTLAGEP